MIIEAKLGEEDRTAKYQIARAKVLRQDADRAVARGERRRLVIALIGGRGYRVRRADMDNFRNACDGGVYTPEMLERTSVSGGMLAVFVSTSIYPGAKKPEMSGRLEGRTPARVNLRRSWNDPG